MTTRYGENIMASPEACSNHRAIGEGGQRKKGGRGLKTPLKERHTAREGKVGTEE